MQPSETESGIALYLPLLDQAATHYCLQGDAAKQADSGQQGEENSGDQAYASAQEWMSETAFGDQTVAETVPVLRYP